MDKTKGLVLRAAVPDERLELEALQWRAALGWDAYREALMANLDAIELPAEQIAAGQVWVAERHGATVGFSIVLPRIDGEAELDGLFVEPGGWRTGVGRALVQEAAGAARARGASWLYVVANPLALAFYQACGFELTGRCDTRFGLGLTMHLALID